MRKIFLILLFTAAEMCVYAQKRKITFRSINAVEYLIGQNADGWGFQSVNGIAWKNYFTGIGMGTDYYPYNSYPIFFDQRIYIGKKRSLFGYGNLGYNFNDKKNKPGKEIYYYSSYHFRGGVYTDIGIGMRIPLKKNNFITFSGGFSYKEIYIKTTSINECLVAPCTVDYNNYQYANGRVTLKAGIDF